jgi:hypothetical protein
LAYVPGPFLGNGSVNTFQLLGSSFLIMQQLDYNNGRAVFYVVRVEMSQASKKVNLVSSVRETVNKGLEPEAENSHC